jgi:hypothetical protein
MRGGTVAGSIHLEQFPPLLKHVFGDGLVAHRRPVALVPDSHAPWRAGRCAADIRVGDRAEIWMETESGARVMEGSASLGPDPDSALRRRLAEVKPAGEQRLLGARGPATRARPAPCASLPPTSTATSP